MFSRTVTQSTPKVATAARTHARTNGLPQRLNQTVRMQQQTRNAGTAGGRSEPDLGGPGGQEAYPASNKVHRKYAMITGAGVVAGLGVMYMMRGENKVDKSSRAA